jgi:hypothetical protein
MVIHIYSIVNTKSMYIYLLKIENSGVAKATLGLNVDPSLPESVLYMKVSSSILVPI